MSLDAVPFVSPAHHRGQSAITAIAPDGGGGKCEMTFKSFGLLSTVSLGVLAIAAPAVVRAQENAVSFALPAGPMQKSLVSVATQANIKILFESELVAGMQAPALQGRFTARQALEKLLNGSSIIIQEVRPGVVVLRSMRTPASTPTQAADPLSAAPLAEPQAPATDITTVAEIIVGTHIRGVTDTASPVVVLGRDDIDRGGYASVADALTALPQAFGGTASEDSLSTGADPNGVNMMRGTGVDLRGLGADATLVLVNGKRMAGAGIYGDFSDISSIPFAAVGRVEVLLDGASALYGADAVGGVVDIRLRKDLDGGDTRVSGATATRGGYERYLFSQALGKTWSSGHLLAAYEYTRNSRLRGIDRPFTGNADLRAFGGTDRRRTSAAQPANILRLNAAGVFVSTYAVPANQNGVGLKPSDFVAGTVNLENQRAAYDVMPKSNRHSALVSFDQSVGHFDFSGDLRFARREIDARNSAPATTIVLTNTNPFFVSPTGQASERISYSFQNEFGGVRNWGVSESLGASMGVKTPIGAGWNAELYGTYAQELGISKSQGQVNSTKLAEAAGNAADSPLTAFSAARDGYFNPYIGKGSNPAAVLDFILSGWDLTKSRNAQKSANLLLDGPLFSLPGGTVRLAVGGQLRHEELRINGASFFTGLAAVDKVRRIYTREVRSAFAELNVPIVGPENARPFMQRLELSAAARIEDYDDVGSTKNPKLGLIWAPSQTLTLKASYGTSFRAPALPELNLPYTISPVTVSYAGGQLPTLVLQGGNPDLDPETAKSWTAGLVFTPAFASDITLGLNAFRTRFKNRIGAPVVLSQALSSAEFEPFRTFITPATNPADRAKVMALINDPHASGVGAFAPESYGAIIEARNVNTSALDVAGLDASLAWKTNLMGDPLAANAGLSWLTRYKRQLTPTSAATQLAGQAGYPADLRARVSATWTRGATSFTTGLNHVGNSYAETGRRVDPWTTVDLQARWQGRLLSVDGVSVTLNVQNVFDQDPPFYDNPLAIAYDPANADPLGRVVTLQLTKTW